MEHVSVCYPPFLLILLKNYIKTTHLFFVSFFWKTVFWRNKWTVDTQIAVLLFSHAKQIPSSPRTRLFSARSEPEELLGNLVNILSRSFSALQAGNLRLRRHTRTPRRLVNELDAGDTNPLNSAHRKPTLNTRNILSMNIDVTICTHQLLKAWFVCQRPAGNVHRFGSWLQFSMLRLMMSFPGICWSCFSILEGHNPSMSHSSEMTCLCSSDPVSPCVLYI